MPSELTETRLALQQVAVHVLSRRRHLVTGRFGLRPSPGGIATPAFGEDAEVVRTCGRFLVVERGAEGAAVELISLRQAAEIVGVDLDHEFSVGDDTPARIDVDAVLPLDDEALDVLAEWYALGSMVIDELVATEPVVVGASTRQLWPEHFDVGGSLTLSGDVRVNVGASPGDASEPRPYLYVGPWDGDRPGDPSYWNAPFGAVLRHDDLANGSLRDRRSQALAFMRRGIDLLSPMTSR